jgi:very-short-patch-repair endonuclease
MTDAEQRLWWRLRRKQICGVTFYRQKPLLNYVVDFYCPRARLVVEVDGGQHWSGEHREKDRRRDQALACLGFDVMRFGNREVLLATEDVVQAIASRVRERLCGRA